VTPFTVIGTLAAFVLLVAAGALVGVAWILRAFYASFQHLLGAAELHREAEANKLSELKQIRELLADPDRQNALGTRLETLEAAHETHKLTLSSALDSITALMNKINARTRRSQRDVLEDEDDDTPQLSDERKTALLEQLVAQGGGSAEPPARGDRDGDLKRRAAAHRLRLRG